MKYAPVSQWERLFEAMVERGKYNYSAAELVALAEELGILEYERRMASEMGRHLMAKAGKRFFAGVLAYTSGTPHRYYVVPVGRRTTAPAQAPVSPASIEQSSVMTQALVYAFQGHEVRTVLIDDEPWFVLNDVCGVLGIANARDTAGRLDDDEKGVGQIYTPGGTQQMTVINESGLYAVIVRSDKPQAKPFRKWVTSEVLPSIRRTGGYQVPQAAPVSPPLPADPIMAQLQVMAELRGKQLEHEARLICVEHALNDVAAQVGEMPISASSEMSYAILSRTDALARELGGTSWAFRNIRGEFKRHFRIPRYDALPQSRFAEAMAWLDEQAAALTRQREESLQRLRVN